MSHRNSSQHTSTDSCSKIPQNQMEPTKKILQNHVNDTFSPQFNQYNKSYTFELPLWIDISMIMSVLTSHFAENILHAEEDEQGGRLILGVDRQWGVGTLLRWIGDCILMLRMQGTGWGYLSQSWGVVTICIKRQVAKDQTRMIVTGHINPSLLEDIQHQLKKYAAQNNFFPLQNQHSNNSPAHIFLQIHQYTCSDSSEDYPASLNYHSIYLQTTSKIQEQIQKYTKNTTNNPIKLVQIVIQQSEILFNSLENVWKQQNSDECEYFKKNLSTSMQRQFTLYSLENLLCLQHLKTLKNVYLNNSKDQSNLFNQQCDQINCNMSNNKYFDYLQVRDKYRLIHIEHPYQKTISILKSISEALSLRQMLLVIQKTYSSAKVDCLMAYGGNQQLNSMDDLLPIMIFITARAGVQNFPLYVKMVDDYIRIKSIFELEERVITTMFVAIEDISKKFKLIHSRSKAIKNHVQNNNDALQINQSHQQMTHQQPQI